MNITKFLSKFFSRSILIIIAIGLSFLASFLANAEKYNINLSLDSPPTHVRNEMFKKYADLLLERTNGDLKITIYHSASQYKGENVAKALAQGALDMGAPSFQHISKYVPETGVVLLPMFYGATLEQVYLFSDGAVGESLYQKVEKKLSVKVLGKPLDLGYGSVFTVDKKIEKTADLSGLKIRIPGGAATSERYRILGAHPTIVGFPDLAQSLQRGTIDGIWSTQESVASTKLWDANVKYGFNDKQAYIQYLPMINIKVWNKLPQKEQQIMMDTWDEMIPQMREYALEKQVNAQKLNEKNGIVVLEASKEDLAQTKAKLMEKQDEISKMLKMDPEFVKQAQKAIGE